MNKTYFLTPGPSELYFTLPQHLKNALDENVGAISHRSTAFKNIFKEAVDNLRALLNIPNDFHIVFTGSANEIWERILQNCVEKNSFHFVNGSFSKKWYEFGVQLNKKPQKFEVPLGQGFDLEQIQIPAETELIACTHNETSSGVMMPVEDIESLREKYPDKIIAVDAVSSLPYPNFDFSKIDMLYFSVQKGFGLPAGLGVWILNQKCVEKAEYLQKNGFSIGTYHALPATVKQASEYQTPETPNVLGIYLLAKICGDMLNKGINKIRQETNYKAALMYHTLSNSDNFQPAISEQQFRSQTVIVAEVFNRKPAEVIDIIKKTGIVIGSGYGSGKDKQIRIANFPTHSKEVFEKLADILHAL